ncbi:hypothetical protein [Tabrizicola sp.]|jgi:hypothetical protein|uniref:hypothetical protein n=1 Tax=Tabrizicola sp. TaxID=2005166 RepID=UPI003D27474A
MELMIWIGAGLTGLGLAGLIYCIWLAARAKRANLPEAEMRAELQRAVVWNMGALAVSGVGLMFVVFGVMVT